MTARFTIGISFAALLLSSGAMADPTAQPEDGDKPATGAVLSGTADTIAQIAAISDEVAVGTLPAVAPADESAAFEHLARPSPTLVATAGGVPVERTPARETRLSKSAVKISLATDKGVAQGARRSQAAAKPRETCVRPIGRPQTGRAAWYGGRYVGRRTSSGGRLDTIHPTAAHRTLPLNSLARVTNLHNGRSVIVRVTDRGPVSDSLLIDMSPRAADELHMKEAGIVPVMVEQVVEVPAGAS